MRAALAATIFGLLAGCAPVLREPPLFTRQCGTAHGFKYCIHPDGAGKPTDTVLYFLHGGGDSEKGWRSWPLSQDFVRRFRDRGVPAPTVVTISFGKLWILSETRTAPDGDLFYRFVNEAMPFVEEKVGRPRKRLLWGMSMGGFNAAQLALKRPELWSATVLSCPAVTVLAPTASVEERAAYSERTGAKRSKVDWMFAQSRRVFPTVELWERHDPLRLARGEAKLPPFLIECGDKDEWGFYEGAEKLSKELAQRGGEVRFEPVPNGAHCAVDADKVLGFLVKEGS